MKTDPVCGMTVSEDDACTMDIAGEIHYFCSEGCRDRFLHQQPRDRNRRDYDLIIIGGGPAGLTAAVYSATLKIDTFVAAANLGGQAIDSSKIKNYMGFDFITGPELTAKFKKQLIHSNYVDHRVCKVERLVPEQNGYRLVLADLSDYRARAIILATGMRRRQLGVPGEERYQRKGIFYGNIQDPSFVQGEDVVVIGGGNSAMQAVESLLPAARQIHVVSDSPLQADATVIEKATSSPRVHLYEGYAVLRIEGMEAVEKVVIRKLGEAEEQTLSACGVFVSIGLHPETMLVRDLVGMNARGEIEVGPDCTTTRPGIFAAGDVTNAYGKRIIIASGEGAKAALAARQYLAAIRRGSATVA